MRRRKRSVAARSIVLRTIFILLALKCPVFSSAAEPEKRISQLSHTVWRLQDGVFDGVPNAIAQTRDGYLWIGTSNGLTRFDGMRFVRWTPPTGVRFPNLNVISLLGSGDGSLWVGLASGFARLKDGRATAYPDVRGRVNVVTEDQSGSIWLGRSRVNNGAGPLCRVTGSTTHCFGKADGIPAPYVATLATDRQGYLWLGHSSSITRWKAGSGTTFDIPALKAAEGLDGLGATLVNPDGSVLVGVPRSGPGLGLQQLTDGRWQSFVEPGLDGSTLGVSALLRDRSGSLWIGTTSDGIVHVQPGFANHFRAADGLSSDGVKQLFEDKEGNIWAVTSLGVDRFRDFKVTTYSRTEGLAADVVQSVLAAHDGTVWVGNFGSLDSIRNGQVSSLTSASGLPGVRVTSLLEDHTGTLWVGVDNQLYTYEHGRFSRIQSQPGTVISMAEDTVGDIWVATASPLALVHLHNRKVVDEASTVTVPPARTIAANPDGGILLGLIDGRLGRLREGKLEIFDLWSPNTNHDSIGSMIAASDGSVWGSSSAGLFHWQNGHLQILDDKNGLPCKRINALVKAGNGDLWLSQPCGFTKIPHDQLEASRHSTAPMLKVEALDVFDGAQPGRSVFEPSASVSPDGKLWFANETLLQTIDPAALSGNTLAPPVHVEEFIADHHRYSPSESLTLPAHTRDLQIDYTALSLTAPQKVRFRYKLEGWDKEWQDPGARRQAFYTNLGPRKYIFRVTGSNNDGVWNEQGATLGFAITPAIYQTTWFYAGCLLAAAMALYSLYWLRLRQLTGQLKARLLERLSERERIARELHDTFFQGIQGLLLRFHTATSQLDTNEPARASFMETLEQSDRVMVEGRELVLDLRAVTTNTLELRESLAQAGEDFKTLSHAEFRVTVTGRSRALQTICAGELYRLGREALYNSFLHAGAGKIEVELHYDPDKLRLRIADDGVGIDDQVLRDGLRAGHWGLPGMQERARKIGAKFRISSRKGGGTEIEVSVPAADAYVPVGNHFLAALRAGWNRA